MTIDEKQEIYQKGFEAGKEHRISAPETMEKISILQINFARMEEKLDNLINLVAGINDGKADKWVEKAMIWLIISTITLDFTIISSVIVFWINKHI